MNLHLAEVESLTFKLFTEPQEEAIEIQATEEEVGHWQRVEAEYWRVQGQLKERWLNYDAAKLKTTGEGSSPLA